AAGERFLRGDHAEVGCGEVAKRAAEGPETGAHRRSEDDLHHDLNCAPHSAQCFQVGSTSVPHELQRGLRWSAPHSTQNFTVRPPGSALPHCQHERSGGVNATLVRKAGGGSSLAIEGAAVAV